MSTDWQRSLVTLTATAVTVVIVVALVWAKAIFIPIALSIFMAFVLSPLVAWVQHRGLGRSLSVITVVGAVIFVCGGIGALITQQVVSLLNDLPDRAEVIKQKVLAAKTWFGGDGGSRFGELVDDISRVISPPPPPGREVVIAQPNQTLSAQLSAYITPAAEFFGQAAFTFILTVYMLIRREDLRNRMIRLLGDGKVTTTTKAVDEATRRISRYLLVQFLINATFGLIITVGLMLIGVDYALLWGFIGAAMRYVPYIGTWVGLILPVLFSFATTTGWSEPLAVFALFGILEAICNNIFEPWLFGASMGLSEVAQLVAAAFWALLWGPIGLILSGPLTTCFLVVGRHVRRFSFLEVILGDRPALTPKVAFYQRLAARDQDEAATIALAVAKESGPDVTLETVVVPALCLARRDFDEGDLDAGTFQYAVHAAREVLAELDELRVMRIRSPEEKLDDRVRVMVVAARDEAEHVAAEVLASALDPTRWEVRVVGHEMLASELVASVEEFRPAVVVVVALPPGGLSHCRYLVGRLRTKCPGVRLTVARWDGGEDGGIPIEGVKGADGVDRTLSETRKRLTEIHAVLVAEEDTREKPKDKLIPAGA